MTDDYKTLLSQLFQSINDVAFQIEMKLQNWNTNRNCNICIAKRVLYRKSQQNLKQKPKPQTPWIKTNSKIK